MLALLEPDDGAGVGLLGDGLARVAPSTAVEIMRAYIVALPWEDCVPEDRSVLRAALGARPTEAGFEAAFKLQSPHSTRWAGIVMSWNGVFVGAVERSRFVDDLLVVFLLAKELPVRNTEVRSLPPEWHNPPEGWPEGEPPAYWDRDREFAGPEAATVDLFDVVRRHRRLDSRLAVPLDHCEPAVLAWEVERLVEAWLTHVGAAAVLGEVSQRITERAAAAGVPGVDVDRWLAAPIRPIISSLACNVVAGRFASAVAMTFAMACGKLLSARWFLGQGHDRAACAYLTEAMFAVEAAPFVPDGSSFLRRASFDQWSHDPQIVSRWRQLAGELSSKADG